ncbi:MAG: hypothetical protein A3H96_13130 [Acidobacteria bacterium RIFCSPLOWO2_02_FULL_67_36]|nr:MAG: hypothetical protein A3H96_13130 [Acidobacteria bacterium RIFCSPLOWO2_02_FULL_67_36]OFW23561.1 MAG: hypothetical protein A3G21_06435 [Acidobacteria bacterium RIFCSPLOWO2_12_FULL_66_21]
MSKKTSPHLGDLQIAVMQILWERQRATLGEIRSALRRARPIATTTVATVLSRLEQSGFVEHREGERSRIYVPRIRHEDFQRSQAQGLVDRLFGGRASELVAHLVRESEIDDEELAHLRRLIRKRESS